VGRGLGGEPGFLRTFCQTRTCQQKISRNARDNNRRIRKKEGGGREGENHGVILKEKSFGETCEAKAISSRTPANAGGTETKTHVSGAVMTRPCRLRDGGAKGWLPHLDQEG